MAFARLRSLRQVPFIPQMDSVECGAAALAMVLAHHGHHAPLAELREACGVSRDGTTAFELVRAAAEYGCEAEGVRAEPEDLAQLPQPAILHWGARHFVVLESARDRDITILDPGRGRAVVPMSECSKKFTGVAILVEPGPGFRARPKARSSLTRYLGAFRTAVPALFQVLAASLLLVMVTSVFPAGMQFLVDRVIAPRHEPWLWALGLALLGAAVTRGALVAVRGWVMQRVQLAMDFTLMTRFFEHLLHLPISFFLQRRVGDLGQRVQAANVARTFIAGPGVTTLLDTLQLVGVGILMMAYSQKLALVVVALGVSRFAVLWKLRRAKQHLMVAEQEAQAGESSALVEAFSALETTKACGAEAHVFARWADRGAERVRSSLPRMQLELTSGRFMDFLQTVALAVVFWLGGREVISERMTVGGFTAFLMLQGLFLGPLEALLRTFNQFQSVGIQLTRLDDVLDTAREPTGRLAPEALTGAIDVEDVSFAYSARSPPVLHGISLHIEAGQKVALVGRTGCGKSTLARLLLGMHQPSRGCVRFDGRDTREFDLARLRAHMGVVLQEPFLFDDTVRANLSIGRGDLPRERLERAAWIACIGDVIEALPEGYDTRLGENGRRLSAGQRQRLALARALAHEPTLLLLDEATSALDLDTEARVHERLASLGCTRIVITHRISAIADADQVIVLDGGGIVQSGRYQRLIGEEGLLRELYVGTGHPMRMQAGW